MGGLVQILIEMQRKMNTSDEIAFSINICVVIDVFDSKISHFHMQSFVARPYYHSYCPSFHCFTVFACMPSHNKAISEMSATPEISHEIEKQHGDFRIQTK
jgi:hypothetical protein